MKYVFFFLLIGLIISGCFAKHKVEEKSASVGVVDSIYHLKVTGDELEGWGYQIYYREKMLIDQKIIPAIAGYNRFATKQEARRVGELILLKLSRGKSDFPSITISELDSLNIKH
jgi:hypothetical protein